MKECKEQVKASQVKKLNIDSAQSAVIYSILRCQMARTPVNTTVLVTESCKNTVIYRVLAKGHAAGPPKTPGRV